MDIPEQWMEEHDEEPEQWNLEFNQEEFDRDPVRWIREHAHAINDIEPVVLYSLALPRDQALLTTAFEDLILKMDRYVDRFHSMNNRLQASSDFGHHSHLIEKTLLPSLQDRIFRVCDILFGPAHFEQNESSKFQAGLKALKEVEDILDQIFSSVTSFWLPNDAASLDFPDVTSYRGQFTQSRMIDLIERLTGLFQIYGALLFISLRVSDIPIGHYGRRKLINDTHLMRDYIDLYIKWLGLSDLGVLQDEWGSMAQDADDVIQGVAELPVFNVYQRLQQDFMSLVKVSRLFYKKMSKANKTDFHPISQMGSIQLAKFLHATLSSGVPQALMNFEFPNPINPEVTLEPSSTLADYFEGPIKILNEYLDHQASNPTSPPDQSHHEFREWYITWKEHFNLAVSRFLATYREVHVDFRNHVAQHHA